MKNKLYQRFLNFSAAALACVAVLVGNASLTVPVSYDDDRQAEIAIQAGKSGWNSGAEIMPLDDSEFITDDFS